MGNEGRGCKSQPLTVPLLEIPSSMPALAPMRRRQKRPHFEADWADEPLEKKQRVLEDSFGGLSFESRAQSGSDGLGFLGEAEMEAEEKGKDHIAAEDPADMIHLVTPMVANSGRGKTKYQLAEPVEQYFRTIVASTMTTEPSRQLILYNPHVIYENLTQNSRNEGNNGLNRAPGTSSVVIEELSSDNDDCIMDMEMEGEE